MKSVSIPCISVCSKFSRVTSRERKRSPFPVHTVCIYALKEDRLRNKMCPHSRAANAVTFFISSHIHFLFLSRSEVRKLGFPGFLDIPTVAQANVTKYQQYPLRPSDS